MIASLESVSHPQTKTSARLVTGLIRTYQVARGGRLSPCRFVPSCSEYALAAVERHGAGRGAWLAVRRLLRCRPWGGHGWDPVPESHPERLPTAAITHRAHGKGV